MFIEQPLALPGPAKSILATHKNQAGNHSILNVEVAQNYFLQKKISRKESTNPNQIRYVSFPGILCPFFAKTSTSLGYTSTL